jgi:hypothetical protein
VGLDQALLKLTDNFPLSASLQLNLDTTGYLEDIDDENIKLTCYRIVQVQLNNIVKHARAKKVMIQLRSKTPGNLELVIRDDGIGFDTDQKDRRHRPAEYYEPGRILQRRRQDRLQTRPGMHPRRHYSAAGSLLITSSHPSALWRRDSPVANGKSPLRLEVGNFRCLNDRMRRVDPQAYSSQSAALPSYPPQPSSPMPPAPLPFWHIRSPATLG